MCRLLSRIHLPTEFASGNSSPRRPILVFEVGLCEVKHIVREAANADLVYAVEFYLALPAESTILLTVDQPDGSRISAAAFWMFTFS
jgi:hypothetical protein